MEYSVRSVGTGSVTGGIPMDGPELMVFFFNNLFLLHILLKENGEGWQRFSYEMWNLRSSVCICIVLSQFKTNAEYSYICDQLCHKGLEHLTVILLCIKNNEKKKKNDLKGFFLWGGEKKCLIFQEVLLEYFILPFFYAIYVYLVE